LCRDTLSKCSQDGSVKSGSSTTKGSVKSKSSKSKRSKANSIISKVYSEGNKSQNSNCSAKLVEAEALVAAGETKLKYLQIVSEQERKLEELRIQKEIEIARAKARVYSSHLSESDSVSNDKAKVTRLDHISVQVLKSVLNNL
jgi:hypothetical protein